MNFFSKSKPRIPPPIVTIVSGLIMYGVSQLFPWYISFAFQKPLFIVISLVALLFLLPAVIQFVQNKTTVNPLSPEKASTLVVSGLFRFSRNPMYLGMALLLAAWGFYLGNPLNCLVFFGFIYYMTRFQIKLEEEALEKLFGEAFIRYKERVRRWL